MRRNPRRRGGLTVIVALVASCSTSDDDTLQPDARPDMGDTLDAAPGCERPALDDADLKQYVSGVVGQLAATPRYLETQRSAARAYLMSELSAQGWQVQLQSYATGANVIASVPATTGTGQLIVLGAHFDTVSGSPGANDNASGAAVVLAVGRYLRAMPCRTAPIALALFDQEEQGLFGSRAYAQTLAPTNVQAVHTIDQVAWDADGDRAFEIERPTQALESEWRAAANVLGVPVTRTQTAGTDHDSFRDLGFAAVGLTEEYVGGDTSPERHTTGDTPASITPYLDYLVLASKLTTHVIVQEVSR